MAKYDKLNPLTRFKGTCNLAAHGPSHCLKLLSRGRLMPGFKHIVFFSPLTKSLVMILLLHFGFLYGHTLASTGDTIENKSELILELSDELYSEFNKGTFSGTAIISAGGKIMLNRSFGFADQDAMIENTNLTISDIGSIAKTFTAAAILKLVEDDKLKLHSQLDSLFENVPVDKKEITIAELLSHHSGLDNFHNETDFDEMSKKEALAVIFALPMIARPGKKIAYSNAAYAPGCNSRNCIRAAVSRVCERATSEAAKTQ